MYDDDAYETFYITHETNFCKNAHEISTSESISSESDLNKNIVNKCSGGSHLKI